MFFLGALLDAGEERSVQMGGEGGIVQQKKRGNKGRFKNRELTCAVSAFLIAAFFGARWLVIFTRGRFPPLWDPPRAAFSAKEVRAHGTGRNFKGTTAEARADAFKCHRDARGEIVRWSEHSESRRLVSARSDADRLK